jgi:hypothetical protein
VTSGREIATVRSPAGSLRVSTCDARFRGAAVPIQGRDVPIRGTLIAPPCQCEAATYAGLWVGADASSGKLARIEVVQLKSRIDELQWRLSDIGHLRLRLSYI